MGMGSEVILMSYREREVNSTVKINKRKYSEMKKIPIISQLYRESSTVIENDSP